MKRPAEGPAKQLNMLQRALLFLVATGMSVWARTLRFGISESFQKAIDESYEPSVVILWHNRLFPAPEFYRRHFTERRLAALISASGDGAWLAGFLKRFRIRPIRGSRYKRGPQAVREMIEASRAGFDIVITPDGSRGPMYDMKAGAVSVAVHCGAPIMLVSFNYTRAWRLKSWDRFYLPVPFSRVFANIDPVGKVAELEQTSPEEIAAILKDRMDRITSDDEKSPSPKGREAENRVREDSG